MKAQEVYRLIEKNQDNDDCYLLLMQRYKITEKTARMAIIMWAIGDLSWFKEKFPD